MAQDEILKEDMLEFRTALVGRKIVDIIICDDEFGDKTFGLLLDDGTFIYASQDNEQNGFGALIHQFADPTAKNVVVSQTVLYTF